jgi:hypothetical protein
MAMVPVEKLLGTPEKIVSLMLSPCALVLLSVRVWMPSAVLTSESAAVKTNPFDR